MNAFNMKLLHIKWNNYPNHKDQRNNYIADYMTLGVIILQPEQKAIANK